MPTRITKPEGDWVEDRDDVEQTMLRPRERHGRNDRTVEEVRSASCEQDHTFDDLFSPQQRQRSELHWTPIDVAIRACTLLAPTPSMRVLDVGSGVGKLCLVGASNTDATWVGAELDADMIREAREAARHLGLEARVTFLHQDATELDWAEFDAIYFFNPFAEAYTMGDLDIAERKARFTLMLERVQRRLQSTRPGTRVVTYHGTGGEMPHGFTLAHREAAREHTLCLWIRNKRG